MRKLTTLLSALAVTAMAATTAVGVASDTGRAQAKPDIVQTAVADGRFDTLAALVEEAGLVDALSADGPLTVFAPTDKAFSKLPKSAVRDLRDDREALRSVLLYHVADGRYRAKRLLRMGSVHPLAGPALRVRERDGGVRVAGAKVVLADVRASNGVIHAINRVLIPPSG